jgi:hypothetical protein
MMSGLALKRAFKAPVNLAGEQASWLAAIGNHTRLGQPTWPESAARFITHART